jgi:NAD(P)-dependent dehydrogenase (short-subunit alcohol dehydrogenase family)
MSLQFSGQVALVTGGGSGIGRVTAQEFAKAGLRVMIGDLSPRGGEETVRLIQQAGGEAAYVKFDVTRANEVEALIRETVQQFGRIDYAFNYATVEGTLAPTAECTEENFNHVIEVNLKGMWLSMKYEILQMQRQGGGVIVNTSSVAGLVGTLRVPAYVASKHGIVGLTKAAALEYARANIRVNAICPGSIYAPAIERLSGNDPQILAQFADAVPAGRLGTPEEVAAAVLWLCSDGASFINGVALPVEGGRVAQ